MADTGSCADNQCTATDGKKSCGISADAAPFTPRNSVLTAASTVSSTKPLSPNAPEFYPRNYAAVFQNDSAATPTGSLRNPLMEVQQTVSAMIDRPADFDQLMAPLVRSLLTNVHDDITLNAIVSELFTQSIQQTNFHYTGARASCYLSQHLKLPFGSFLEQLVIRCQNKYSSILQAPSSAETLSSLVGFTIFMGELLLSIKHSNQIYRTSVEERWVRGYHEDQALREGSKCPEARRFLRGWACNHLVKKYHGQFNNLIAFDSGLFIPELPQQIAQLLLTLLAHETHEALHCAVQVLKLTGAVLEDLGTDLSQIFSELQRFSLNSAIPQSTQFMISSLIELRANNWGRREDEVATASGAGDTKNYISTAEAVIQSAGFRADEVEDFEQYGHWSGAEGGGGGRGAGTMNLNNDGNVQYWIGDQVMDADTANAFEEFIAETQPPPAVPAYWSYQP